MDQVSARKIEVLPETLDEAIKAMTRFCGSGRAGEGLCRVVSEGQSKRCGWLTIVQLAPRNGSITGDLLRMGAWISTLTWTGKSGRTSEESYLRSAKMFASSYAVHQRADFVYRYADLIRPLQCEGIWWNDTCTGEQEAAPREALVAEKIFD